MSRVQHCVAPCNLAQAIAEEDSAAVRSIHMAGELVPASPLLKKCPCGLTSRQAIMLCALSGRQGCIITYADIAELLDFLWKVQTTKVAVRELSEKLNARGFFAQCCTEHEGILQGKVYQLSAKNCPWLVPPHPPAHASAFAPTFATASALALTSDATPAPTAAFAAPRLPASSALLLKKEEDEEKGGLPLSREDHAHRMLTDDFFTVVEQELLHKWSCLRQKGFDFPTFKNAARASKDPALLLQTWRDSLDYAEFDLQQCGGMCEPDGTPVKDPRMWLFGCLRKSGHYPRPRDYRTPAELQQAAECRAEEEKHSQHDEAAFAVAFEGWRASLSEEEIRKIGGPHCRNAVPLPLLRNRFREIQKQQDSMEQRPQQGQQQAMSSLNTSTLALRG